MRCKHCNREIRKTPDGWLDDTTSTVSMDKIKYQAWCEEHRVEPSPEFGGHHEPTKESVILTILETIDSHTTSN